MTADEELIQLRQENRLLREQIALQKQLIEPQQEPISLLEKQDRLQQQIKELTEQVQALQERLAKDSHTSHCPRRRIGSAVNPRVCARRAERSQAANWAIGAAA